MNSLNKKIHITLIAGAALAVLLLYTTKAFALIGIGTGLSLGLSWRLYFAHKRNGFAGTKQLDWILLSGFSTAAFCFMLAEYFTIQALLLIFVAVRALLMYFALYSRDEQPVSEAKPNN